MILNLFLAVLLCVGSVLALDCTIKLQEKIEELQSDVTMYESMVEGLILTNKEQHNMLLECMEGE